MRLGLKARKRAGAREKSTAIRKAIGNKSVVLIGLMGAGKTAIGRRLATRLGLRFIDADSEIERAAGQSVSDIFAEHGEEYFREGERKVIARLLDDGPQVLATGGGAYINSETRKIVAKNGVSVWLKADLDILLERLGDAIAVRCSNRRSETSNAQIDGRAISCLRRGRYHGASRSVTHSTIVSEIVKALHAALVERSPAGRL